MSDQYQDRDNEGTVGANKRKRTGTNPRTGKPYNDPDATGHGMVNGQAVWINGWWKQNRNTGEKFMRLLFKPKEDQPPQQQHQDTGSSWDQGFGGDNQPPQQPQQPQQQPTQDSNDGAPPPDDNVPF